MKECVFFAVINRKCESITGLRSIQMVCKLPTFGPNNVRQSSKCKQNQNHNNIGTISIYLNFELVQSITPHSLYLPVCVLWTSSLAYFYRTMNELESFIVACTRSLLQWIYVYLWPLSSKVLIVVCVRAELSLCAQLLIYDIYLFCSYLSRVWTRTEIRWCCRISSNRAQNSRNIIFYWANFFFRMFCLLVCLFALCGKHFVYICLVRHTVIILAVLRSQSEISKPVDSAAIMKAAAAAAATATVTPMPTNHNNDGYDG